MNQITYASWIFEVRMSSDQGDYIGQWKKRLFSSAKDDVVSVKKTYEELANDHSYTFSVTSFDLGTPLNFTFKAWTVWGKLMWAWLFYPAKRAPFSDVYNGIDISWDGRWCNTLLWWFYIHEFVLWPGNTVEKAAIDFVQYCEGGSAWLYWSLRYNSSIAHSCTTTSCSKVKELVLGKKERTEEETQQHIFAFINEIKEKYPLFYNACIKKDIEDKNKEGITLIGDNRINYFDSQWCDIKYRKDIAFINKIFTHLWGPYWEVPEENNSSSTELFEVITWVIKKIDNKRKSLDAQWKLTERIDFVLSGIAIVFEIVKLWIEIEGSK